MSDSAGLCQEHRTRIRENWAAVQADVAAAAVAAGRDPAEIKIVGVTKYVDAETTAALVDAGCNHLGENRPQVLWNKAESGRFADSVCWHAIGHLQRNKVRRTLKHASVIQSVDSARLLEAVAAESQSTRRVTEVMIEVNISGDGNKTGMSAEQLETLLQQPVPSGVRVIGLMAMAGLGAANAQVSRQFSEVRQLRDRLATAEVPLSELSMGMSGDFAEAIAEGTTMVRIGSRLFQGVMDAH